MSFKSFIRKVGKVANDAAKGVGKVLDSPVVKTAAGITAVVYPPVGVPAVAAMATASRVAKSIDSSIPDERNAARRLLVNTATMSKRGSVDARRMLQTIAIMHKLGKGQRLMFRGKDVTKKLSMLSPNQKAYVIAALVRSGKFKADMTLTNRIPGTKTSWDQLRKARETRKLPTLAKKSSAREAAHLRILAKRLEQAETRGKLKAIKQFQDAASQGILLGRTKVRHGRYAPVP